MHFIEAPFWLARRISVCVSLFVACSVSIAESSHLILERVSVRDRVGVNIHFTTGREKDVEKIAQLGVRVVRVDMHWAGVEQKPGKYQWASYDELVAQLNSKSIRPYFILAYGNEIYTKRGGGRVAEAPATDISRDAFAKFSCEAMKRYSHLRPIWEVWNEANHKASWYPKPSAGAYVDLLREVANVAQTCLVEGGKPLIVGPALAGQDYSYLQEILDLGALEFLDGISVHPYRDGPPESVGKTYSVYRNMIAHSGVKVGDDKKRSVLSGEWGYSSYRKGVSEPLQGAYAVRSILSNLKSGVPISIWYSWMDGGVDLDDKESSFGLVRRNLSPKDGYYALSELLRSVGDLTPVESIEKSAVRQNYYSLEFSGVDHSGKEILKEAFWTEQQKVSLVLPQKIGCMNILVTELGGAERKPPRYLSCGQVQSITLGLYPVIVEYIK
jgi:hypothetical protein